MKVLRTFERKMTAQQGRATRALLFLLTKLKVNRKCVENMSMQKTLSCEMNEYRVQLVVREK